jgi:hypothetical protein
MKKTLILTALTAAILSSGCVATTYSKSVTVTKDADGKILNTVETEAIVQPGGQGWPVKFDHLKGVQTNGPK